MKMPSEFKVPTSSAFPKDPKEKSGDDDVVGQEHKLHVSRVPTKFDEEIVKRILEDCLGQPESVVQVELVYPLLPEEDEENGVIYNEDDPPVEHRGFGFVCLQTPELLQKALALQTIKGGRKPTSTRKHTMHLRPYVANEEQTDVANESKMVCYLWSQNRCPYGEECKFLHSGEGGCIRKSSSNSDHPSKKRGKCFDFKRRGKCGRGENCPFSHHRVPVADDSITGQGTCKTKPTKILVLDKSEKHCIEWKTKGKCRRGDACEYRHDLELQKLALEKKQKKRKDSQPPQDENPALLKKQKKKQKKNNSE